MATSRRSPQCSLAQPTDAEAHDRAATSLPNVDLRPDRPWLVSFWQTVLAYEPAAADRLTSCRQ